MVSQVASMSSSFPYPPLLLLLVANYHFEWNNMESIGSSDLHLTVSFFYKSIMHL